MKNNFYITGSPQPPTKIGKVYCILLQSCLKPSWKNFRKLMGRSLVSVDARKSTRKKDAILSLILPCGTKWVLWKATDFPSGDVPCLCGCGDFFIKWEKPLKLK